MAIKCIYCGKFISYDDIHLNKAKQEFTPDTPFGPEELITICEKCNVPRSI